MDGLWYLVMNLNGKQQGCAIVIRDGKVLGGDSAMTYEGQVSVSQNGAVDGTIKAEAFMQLSGEAFFPGIDSLTFSISAQKVGDSLSGTATTSLAPGVSVLLSGKKKADL